MQVASGAEPQFVDQAQHGGHDHARTAGRPATRSLAAGEAVEKDGNAADLRPGWKLPEAIPQRGSLSRARMTSPAMVRPNSGGITEELPSGARCA